MKVLIIHNCNNIGGGTISCLDIAKMFREYKFKTTILLPEKDSPAGLLFENNNFEVTSFPFELPTLFHYNGYSSRIKALKNYIWTYKNQSKWLNYFKKRYFDFVVLNSVVIAPLINVLNKVSIKSFCFIRETRSEKKTLLLYNLQKKYLLKASKLFYLSTYDLQDWNIGNRNSYVVPDCISLESKQGKQNIDFNLISSYIENYDSDLTYILFCGGIEKIKGIEIILKVFAHVTNAKLIILGVANQYESPKKIKDKIFHREYFFYKKIIKKIAEINENACYQKIITVPAQTDISSWFMISSFIVFPAKVVHQARPIYEAGFYNKPIILPNYKNYYEYFSDGITGYFYKKNNEKELLLAIQKMIDKPDKTIQMGVNNHDFTVRLHDYNLSKLKIKEAIIGLGEI